MPAPSLSMLTSCLMDGESVVSVCFDFDVISLYRESADQNYHHTATATHARTHTQTHTHTHVIRYDMFFDGDAEEEAKIQADQEVREGMIAHGNFLPLRAPPRLAVSLLLRAPHSLFFVFCLSDQEVREGMIAHDTSWNTKR
jgi:hypothetical protein